MKIFTKKDQGELLAMPDTENRFTQKGKTDHKSRITDYTDYTDMTIRVIRVIEKAQSLLFP